MVCLIECVSASEISHSFVLVGAHESAAMRRGEDGRSVRRDKRCGQSERVEDEQPADFEGGYNVMFFYCPDLSPI